MYERYEHDGLVWVDLESPEKRDIERVMEEFGIVPAVAEELLLPSERPRADFYDGYVYLVLHFPALHHSHKSHVQEVDFVIGKKFLVTTRYDTVDPLHKFSKLFEVHAVLNKSGIGEHGGYLFFYMLKKLYGAVEYEVEYIRHDIGMIEDEIFSGEHVRLVETISRSARDLLTLRQTIEPHREILRSMEENGAAIFGEPFTSYLKLLSSEYYRVHNHIMRETESLHELRETNNSLLTTRQNEIMKNLTIIAFVTLPLSFIAALFQMDAPGTPPFTFWQIVGTMALIGVLMYVYFKYKRWL